MGKYEIWQKKSKMYLAVAVKLELHGLKCWLQPKPFFDSNILKQKK